MRNVSRYGLALLGLLIVQTAVAQTYPASYPTKPIRFVVGFGAGGANDMIARMLGRKLADAMGQPVVIDNRAGGAGIVAATMTAKAPPDGYTLFSGSIRSEERRVGKEC